MDKFKNYLIIALIVIIGLFGFFGGHKVKKFSEEIATLKYEKTTLAVQNKLLDDKNKFIQAENKKHEATIDSCRIVFKQKDRIIAGLSADLDSALAKLDGITSDSSYQFLQEVAYKYPGLLKYLFNETQIRHIHADYLKARNSEQIIPAYKEQLSNCKVQLSEQDAIQSGLNKIIENKGLQLANCEKINADNEQIIKDTEKQRDKERHRKNFWRMTTGIATGVAIVIGAFGL